jgi:hypothetical protein
MWNECWTPMVVVYRAGQAANAEIIQIIEFAKFN